MRTSPYRSAPTFGAVFVHVIGKSLARTRTTTFTRTCQVLARAGQRESLSRSSRSAMYASLLRV